MPFNPSPQQQAIFDWAVNSTGSLNIQAFAGCGKTTSLIELCRYLTGRVYLGAYNKAIATELSIRLSAKGLRPPRVEASTLHAAGLKAIKSSCPRIKIDGDKCGELLTALCNNRRRMKDYSINAGRKNILALVSLAKQHCVGIASSKFPEWSDEKVWEGLATAYGIDEDMKPKRPGLTTRRTLDPPQAGLVDKVQIPMEDLVQGAIELYQESADTDERVIDFDDMIFTPLLRNYRVPTYDWVLIDECLVGDTPILLADGTLMKIQDMVDGRYSGLVQSFVGIARPECKGGETVSRRVVGWHKIPLTRPLVRITTRRVGASKDGVRFSPKTECVRFGNRFLVCTEDHLLLTSENHNWGVGGVAWRPAGGIAVGDFLVEESHAPKDPRFQSIYKHGVAGRARLSELMAEKNSSGACGSRRGLGRVPVQGGNGRGLTKYQDALLQKLGEGWVAEHVVRTGMSRSSGFPFHYKLDLANPSEMIALELDGHSHNSAKAKLRDAKKADLLSSLGWTVLHFNNQETITLTRELIQQRMDNSPVLCEVVSVEPFTPTDPFVYDIDVEDTHNFYANGIVVHNCQDTNPARRLLALAMLDPINGRFVGVGDRHQAIYRFAGADSDAMDLVKAALGSQELPLSVTYRCPKEVVKEANELVPDLTAHESAPQGMVRYIDYNARTGETVDGNAPSHLWAESLTVNDSILCRNTRPLVETFFRLLDSHDAPPLRLETNTLASPYLSLIDQMGVDHIKPLTSKLENHRRVCEEKWREGRPEKYHAISDKIDTILLLANRCLNRGQTSVESLKTTIQFVFSNGNNEGKDQEREKRLTLCTVHKSKGREWDRVYILGRNLFMPSKYAKKPEEIEQEKNLEYVAITRAKRELVYIECRKEDFVQTSPDPDEKGSGKGNGKGNGNGGGK